MVYNSYGQQLITESTAEREVQLDLSSFSPGVYLLEYRSKSGISRESIVKN